MNPLDHPLDLQAHDDGQTWTVLSSVCYASRDGRMIVVPAGYVTDFASVPRALWWLLPPTGRYLYAALIHDRIYDLHHAGSTAFTRGQADRILREAMAASGVRAWQRWAIYLGVRIGGWAYWSGKG